MMEKIKNLLAGFAGALALNILHETVKTKSNNVPRIDLLGEDALQKTLKYFGGKIDKRENLYQATLAGDLLSNTIYYSLIGSERGKYVWQKAAVLGLSAGIGAITLPKPMGLDEKPVAKNDQVKVLTVGYYLFGALVTGLIVKALSK